jgi:hypothetical protein
VAETPGRIEVLVQEATLAIHSATGVSGGPTSPPPPDAAETPTALFAQDGQFAGLVEESRCFSRAPSSRRTGFCSTFCSTPRLGPDDAWAPRSVRPPDGSPSDWPKPTPGDFNANVAGPTGSLDHISR